MTGGRRIGATATVLGAAALLAALAFLPRGGVDTGAPAADTEATPVAPRLPPAAQANRAEPATGTAQEAAGEEAAATPCEGCLDEPAALDVAETFLFHMRADYIDVRAELYADIAATLEAAGLPPPHETWLPKLPPGLADAPAGYSVSNRRLPEVPGWVSPDGEWTAGPGETWVVWVQEGWFTGWSLEHLISIGDLPRAAASWPPLKWETYMLVDARSGAVYAAAMWPLGTPVYQDMRTYGDRAREEAAGRAAHWIDRLSGPSPP